MKLEDYFKSDTAKKLGIDNKTNDTSIICNIVRLDRYVVQPLIDAFPNASIHVTSGYRCEALNKAVGGVKNSQHTLGQAVDLKCDITQFWKVMAALKCRYNWMSYDQCICYAKSHFFHISFVSHEDNRNEYIEMMK